MTTHLPFQYGLTLERIQDDVLHEIISHLPALTEHHILYEGERYPFRVIPSEELVRMPVLRALSKTSRILRARCLAMAWRNIELCGVKDQFGHPNTNKELGNAIISAARFFKACPHLSPLVRTVAVALTSSRPSRVIPCFANCLKKLPNLTTIQIIYASHVTVGRINKEFQGLLFPSIRKITLPCEAHGIIKCCPNLEEVVNVSRDRVAGIVESLAEGNCRQVRILKGMVPPLAPLVGLLPNLKHLEVQNSTLGWGKSLADFPFLDTVEIRTVFIFATNIPLVKCTDAQINEAMEILKANASSTERRVIKLHDPFGRMDPDIPS